MDTVETKKLNRVQKVCAKMNFWMSKQEERTGSIVFYLPTILAFIFGVAIFYIIEFINPTTDLALYPVLAGMLVGIMTQVVILDIGRRYKVVLPEFQVRLEKEKLERLLGRAISLKSTDARAKTESVDQLIKRVNMEFMKEDDTPHLLKHIRETTKRLEEFVHMLETIRAKEAKIKTIEQEYKRLPEEKSELEDLKQKFDYFYP